MLWDLPGILLSGERRIMGRVCHLEIVLGTARPWLIRPLGENGAELCAIIGNGGGLVMFGLRTFRSQPGTRSSDSGPAPVPIGSHRSANRCVTVAGHIRSLTRAMR
ncbi:hypothetical protein Bxe_C1378 [Paraburkholderia xenovorans LB400]|uniref:Uncharacterized protein n=1 Tax=Paraburkholderia xenovorans (strain LB400) TaxID=266265 RepID=Q13FB3_PARXL|nr:hypothetical protein Bxe_C1378 [Paraburkholderia xenovorans LB400]